MPKYLDASGRTDDQDYRIPDDEVYSIAFGDDLAIHRAEDEFFDAFDTRARCEARDELGPETIILMRFAQFI